MRILVSTHHELDWNAGAPGAMLAITASLRELGHHVTLRSFDNLPRGWAPQMKMVAYPWAFASHVIRHSEAYDVIDAHTGDAWVWSLMRFRGSRPPLVVHSHGIEHLVHQSTLQEAEAGRLQLSRKYPLYHGGWRLREVAITLRRSDAAIFLNRHERDYAMNSFCLDASRCFVVHHGLPPELVGLEAPAPKNVNGVGIVQIGTYIHRKGVPWAVGALDDLMADHRDVSVTLLGTKQPREAILKDFRPQHHRRLRVLESFDRRDLPSLLRGHQIVLSAALVEGFGMALLEAMACGLAAVSTNIPGPAEYVVDGENGLLVPPADARAIRVTLERLVTDGALLQQLRVRAYETAQAFTWKANANRRLDSYRLLLEDTRRRERAARNQGSACGAGR